MKTDDMNLEKMVNSLTMLLGMSTAMLFEMEKKMTQDQVNFFKWWKDAMYAVVYKGEPVPLHYLLDKK